MRQKLLTKSRFVSLAITMAISLSGCGKATDETPVSSTSSGKAAHQSAENLEVQVESDAKSGDWSQHGRTADESRYSPLQTINRDNIKNLKLAWYQDLPEARGQEATPLVIDGVMYTTSAWSHVLAFDAVTGEALWHFDPKVPKEIGYKGCCDVVNRGVAYLDGKVFVGSFDGRLIAIDAENGNEIWSVLTVDQSENYTITGAPRIINGKVFIGNGGAEYGVRGYISAYSAETGDLIWRFYTVPGGPGDPVGVEPVESQKATWNGEWWKLGGGGTVWDSMAYDAATNILYFGVGNGSPWNPNTRTDGEGDNWFLSSIVAVDADTGSYKWHYQTTPGEGWDFTATQHMILADIDLDGEVRKVIMQAPKNGFFYILDRETGELLSAENFVTVNWASHVDLKTGRPVVVPAAEYWKTGEPVLMMPSWAGGHNWHPMSFSAETQLVYLPAQEIGFPYLNDDDQSPSQLVVNLGIDTSIAGLPDDPAVVKKIKDATSGRLVAWDPKTQQEVWRVEYPGAWNGGVLSTAGGLVFQGSATGYLNAYDAEDGTTLWQFPTQTGVVAPPISYSIGGEQYVSVSVGWGGIFPLIAGPLVWDASDGQPINRSRLLTFKLDGKAELPPTAEQLTKMPDLSALKIDPEKVKEGFVIYDRYCGSCHGAGGVGGGVVPDLRYSGLVQTAEGFNQVVLDGALNSRGMTGFAAELSKSDAEAVRAYIISRNQYANEVGDTQRLSR